MQFATIRYETRGSAALISYDRQERRNAWDLGMYREIVAAIEQANADPDVGAIVITNEGPVFCAGADYKATPEPLDPVTGRSPNLASGAMAPDTGWLHLLARSKPTIAAVRGLATGLGVTHILPCDLRIAGLSARFAFPFLKLGTMPELGSTALLPRLVGTGRALQLCLTAADIDAAEAERIGLIGEVCNDADVLDRALELAEQIATYPALQLRLTRQLFADNASERDLNALLRRESEAFVTLIKARRTA
jgi:2-(1,2-epoxy-1,2-dihydrophenyl)acetyl-CoA isomerase